MILPVGFLGSSFTTLMSRGTLNPAMCSRQNDLSAPSSNRAPSLSSTNASATSPRIPSCIPMTAESLTESWRLSTSSISRGKTFSPPMMSISLMRPVIESKPCSSSRPMSPVLK